MQPYLIILLVFVIGIATTEQVEKRFNNDFYGLLNKYQIQQKRFNNDFYTMLNRYQERPLKRLSPDLYGLLNNYQAHSLDIEKRFNGDFYNLLAQYQRESE